MVRSESTQVIWSGEEGLPRLDLKPLTGRPSSVGRGAACESTGVTMLQAGKREGVWAQAQGGLTRREELTVFETEGKEESTWENWRHFSKGRKEAEEWPLEGLGSRGR